MLGAFTAGCCVMRDDFLAANPNTAKKLFEGTARAVRWARTHSREEVVARSVGIVERRGRNEDTSGVEYWRSTGVAGPDGLIAEEEFSTWSQRLTAEGRIDPDEVSLHRLHTNDFNPFRHGRAN